MDAPGVLADKRRTRLGEDTGNGGPISTERGANHEHLSWGRFSDDSAERTDTDSLDSREKLSWMLHPEERNSASGSPKDEVSISLASCVTALGTSFL